MLRVNLYVHELVLLVFQILLDIETKIDGVVKDFLMSLKLLVSKLCLELVEYFAD